MFQNQFDNAKRGSLAIPLSSLLEDSLEDTSGGT